LIQLAVRQLAVRQLAIRDLKSNFKNFKKYINIIIKNKKENYKKWI